LTINANLTVTGTFSPDGGFLAFGSNADQLILDGDMTRKSGTFLGTAGTVVFSGAAQSVTDTSGRTFGWNVVVNSAAGVTVQPGSRLTVGNNATVMGGSKLTLAGDATMNVGGNFTSLGTVNLNVAAPGNAVPPLAIGGTFTTGAAAVFNFTVAGSFAGASYLFITFGGTATIDPGTTFNVFGDGAAPAVNKLAHAITVTAS
jgi:hypothetical protein